MARLIMVGTCPKCGQTVTSRYPFEIGVCPDCNPSTEIPLKLAIVMPARFQEAIEIVEKHSGIEAENLLSELLHQTSEALVRGLKIDKEKKSHPTIKIV